MDNIDWKYCKFSLWIITFVVYREYRNLWWFTLRQTIIDSIGWKYCKFSLWIISFVVFRWYERLFPFLHIKFTICHIVWDNLLWFHQFGILRILFFFFLAGTLFYVNSDFVCVLSILTKLHLCSSISQCNLMCVVKENFITLTLKIFWALERSPNKYYEQREPTQKKYRCKHTKNYMVRQQPMSTGDNKEISLTNLV